MLEQCIGGSKNGCLCNVLMDAVNVCWGNVLGGATNVCERKCVGRCDERVGEQCVGCAADCSFMDMLSAPAATLVPGYKSLFNLGLRASGGGRGSLTWYCGQRQTLSSLAVTNANTISNYSHIPNN